MRLTFMPLLALVAGCATPDAGTTTTEPLTPERIGTLPVLQVSEGSVVCISTGRDGCPQQAAVANRLDNGKLALWQPGFNVTLFAPGDTVGTSLPLPGGVLDNHVAVAATSIGRDRYRVILAGENWRVLELSGAGEVLSVDAMPDGGALTGIGYVGSQLVRQRMTNWWQDEGGRLVVTALRDIGDTTGRELLNAPLHWLRGGEPDAPPGMPLIAASPSWALTENGDVIWSPGDSLVIERRSPEGQVRWRLSGPAGPPVTAADLDMADSLSRALAGRMPFDEADFVAMRTMSDTLHPAVTALTATPEGTILAALTNFPTRDSIEYLRVAGDGTLLGRFALDKRYRILLTEGDSLLTHMPTEGEPWQVKWLHLQTPP